MSILENRNRPLRICILNQEPRIVDRHLASIEKELEKIYDFELVKIASIDDDDLNPCDLLIMIAHHLNDSEMSTWVKGLAQRMDKNNNINVPALIIGDSVDQAANDLMSFAVSQNWYFDLIDIEHIDSISIRAANLLRIHDHIHELGRYESTIQTLEKQVKELEKKVN